MSAYAASGPIIDIAIELRDNTIDVTIPTE